MESRGSSFGGGHTGASAQCGDFSIPGDGGSQALFLPSSVKSDEIVVNKKKSSISIVHDMKNLLYFP